MLIVLHHIQVPQCFVSIMRMKMSGLELNINHLEVIIGLVILTCHHMEEGKVPRCLAGSQDALLLTPNGILLNQTIN